MFSNLWNVGIKQNFHEHDLAMFISMHFAAYQMLFRSPDSLQWYVCKYNDFTKILLTWPSSSLPLNYCNYNLQAYLFNNPLCSNFKYALSTWMQFFQINTFKNRKSWCGLNHTYQQYKSTFYGTWIHFNLFFKRLLRYATNYVEIMISNFLIIYIYYHWHL